MSNKQTTLTGTTPVEKSSKTNSVVDEFNIIDSWKHSVQIRTQHVEVEGLVGRQTDFGRRSYRIYHHPRSNATGIVGVIIRESDISNENETVKFIPADLTDNVDGDENGTEKKSVLYYEEQVESIVELNATRHNRGRELDAVLPLIRESLTNETWIRFDVDVSEVDLSKRKFLIDDENHNNGFDTNVWVPVDPEAGWGAWQDAGLNLREFFDNHYDNEKVAVSPDSITETRLKHELARYPHTAEQVIDCPANKIRGNGDNPEAIRSLLIDYAKYRTCFVGVKIPITCGVVYDETINKCCKKE